MKSAIRSSVLTCLVLLLVASCSSGSNSERVDTKTVRTADEPVPNDIQLSVLKGSTVNLANRVTPEGDLYFTLLDSIGSSYGLYRFNIFSKQQSKLAEMTSKSSDGRRPNSVRAILDVVVNEQQVMLLSELQYSGADGANRSVFSVDVLDMRTGAIVKKGEMWMGGTAQTQNCSPWASWLTWDGSPVVYLSFLESKSSVPLPRMACDVGHDRYEFVVKRDVYDWKLAKAHAGGYNYRLQISCVPYDTLASVWLEWDHGGRQQRKVYDGPLAGIMEYDWYENEGMTQAPLYSWAGSFNAIKHGDKLYFMLNDALLALRNGQVERIASLDLSGPQKLDGSYFPRFIAPEGFWTGIAGVERDRSGFIGGKYRKLYSEGKKLYVGVDARRLYEYDMNSSQGRFLPLDTTACLGCGPSEFFIGEGSIWQLQPSLNGKSLLRFDRSGTLVKRYVVHYDGYEVTEGRAQVLALEDRSNGTVSLYLMQPVTQAELSGTEFIGYDPTMNFDEAPDWSEDEGMGDSTIVPSDIDGR